MEREIFLSDVPLPGVGFKVRAEFFGDRPGAVGGAGIDDDDFLGQLAGAGEATGQIFLFVESNDGDRKR